MVSVLVTSTVSLRILLLHQPEGKYEAANLVIVLWFVRLKGDHNDC